MQASSQCGRTRTSRCGAGAFGEACHLPFGDKREQGVLMATKEYGGVCRFEEPSQKICAFHNISYLTSWSTNTTYQHSVFKVQKSAWDCDSCDGRETETL